MKTIFLLCLFIGLTAAVAPTAAPAAPTPTPAKSHVPLDSSTTALILVAGFFSLLFAYFQFSMVAKIKLGEGVTMQTQLLTNESNSTLIEIYEAIREGARSFLKAEYKICGIFIVVFGGLIFVLTSYINNKFDFASGGLTALAFVVGALTSMISGYIGMMVAVFSNARTTVSAMTHHPWTDSFNTAFRAGGVMGFALCGLALLSMYALCVGYNSYFTNTKSLFECVAGFGLGGSSIAMFGRVGGGIYTKAADVGADLAGKVVANIPEDDPRNPATIADNVGDNVGDVAGMGSDLFGSFAEASCAAFVVMSTSVTTVSGGNPVADPIMEWRTLMFPALISCLGIFVCAASSFVATHISPVRRDVDVEKVLKMQIFVTTILLTALLYPLAEFSLNPMGVDKFEFYVYKASGLPVPLTGSVIKACVCVWAGLWAGCLIGFITEYYTSHSYKPTREVAQSCETGAATNIIYGLALGYKSAVIPVTLISVVVLVSFSLLDMFGVALAALGMLSNLATCLSIDVYGPVCDNAGGIAEMAELPEEVRAITDELDAAGNTTAAIGKGFAIGSACLVGLALFGAFIKRSSSPTRPLDSSLLDPLVFSFLLLGAMIPYWFTALTMKSVGVAAMAMVQEVAHQFKTKKGLLEGTPGHEPPDHARCIAISTDAALREMILPGILVMFTPLLTGIFFGSKAVVGLLSGAIASAVQMAISQSNTGGAWDNAKKYVEKGCVFIEGEDGVKVKQGKGTDIHKAAVVGDTVGDPLKDTSGPALNIVMKLMAILSLVFADFFNSICDGKGLIGQYIS
jgi:H(+)-translocating pyrophosphatase